MPRTTDAIGPLDFRSRASMPASPKATVVGLGLATAIAAAVFLVPAVVLTQYFGNLTQRQKVQDEVTAAVSTLRLDGVERNALPPATIATLSTGDRLFPIVGELTAWDGQDIPLHRQPKAAIVWIAGPSDRDAPIEVDEFAAEDASLMTVVGSTGRRGIPIAFADGTVWLMRETTPGAAIGPFLRRDTLVKFDRDEWLGPFRLRDQGGY